MKSTGVFRRIDNMGRIVIPKEIRKNLKIKDGESLEIFIDDDAVVLKKYSYMCDLHDIAQNCSDSFYDVINKEILITDLNKIIAVSGSLKKKYLGKEISKYLGNIINRSRITVEDTKPGIELIDKVHEESKYVICSVVVSGDAVGAVIILFDDQISDTIEKTASFIAKFLGKHLE